MKNAHIQNLYQMSVKTYFTEFKNFQNVLIYLIAVGVSSGVI